MLEGLLVASGATTSTADRILDVAERLVQVHGYNGFSYADIAAELRIRKPSLHHHFPTKAALGKALITRYRSRFLTALAAIDQDRTGAADKLEQYARLYSGVLRKRRMCLCGMLAADFETLPKSMRDGVSEFFAANETWLARVLEEGRRARTLRFDGPAASIAAFLVSALEGAMLVARSYGSVSRFESVASKLLADLRAQRRSPV
jgi:TetR/AcrR family transcriptional regulator, transcriptional repressor for nem operon